MGQRLVISIRNMELGETLVNVYKHWSAYTGSAIEETNQFIDVYNEWAKTHPSEKTIFGKTDQASVNRQKEIIAILMMEAWPGAHPAGFKEDVKEYDETTDPEEACAKYATDVKMFLVSMGMMELASKLGDVFSYNRNDGLIGITESGIQDYQDWSEGDVDILINTNGDIQEIYFGVMWGNTYQEALDDEESEDDLLECMYETDFVNNDDFGVFTMDDWYEFNRIVDEAWKAGKYKIGSKKKDAVWSFIE